MSVIQTIMAGENVLDVTWTLTRTTILRYWDADQAKKAGHHTQSAHKLSAVKKYQGLPSFCSQAAPPAGGSSQGKKKRGSAGKLLNFSVKLLTSKIKFASVFQSSKQNITYNVFDVFK